MPIGSKLGRLYVELFTVDSAFNKGLDAAEKRLKKTGTVMSSFATTVTDKVTVAFKTATTAAGALSVAAGVVGSTFESQMAQVAAITGATDAQLAALTDQARELGRTTEFTATQGASALTALARAGATVEESITASSSALLLAGTSGAELEGATNVLIATMRQFGLGAEESNRIVDVLSMSMRSSLLDFESLREAMKFAGTAGASFGMTLEETVASVAAFRDLGLEGSLAGTNLRMALISAAKGGDNAEAALSQLGLTLDDINPAAHNFGEIVRLIGERGITAEQSIAIFGARAGNSIAELATQTREGLVDIEALTKTLEAAGGATAEMYQRIGDTVLFQSKLMVSAFQDLLLTIFDKFADPLQRLLQELQTRLVFFNTTLAGSGDEVGDSLNKVVDGVLALIDQLIVLSPHLETVAVLMATAFVAAKGVQWAVAISGLAKAVGVDLVAAFAKAVTGLKSLTAVQAGFAATGVGAAIAAIGVLIAGFVKLTGSITGATQASRELEGQLAGAEAVRAMTEKQAKALEAHLALTKSTIQARIEDGQQISAQEQALLRMTAAQAQSEIQAGRLVMQFGELVPASQVSTDALRDQASVLSSSASEFDAMANRLDFLKEQYESNIPGAIDIVNDAFNGLILSGPLSKAEEELGRPIRSFEDLAAATEEFRGRARLAREQSEGLTASIAEQGLVQSKLRKQLVDTALTEELLTKQTKELTDEQRKYLEVMEALQTPLSRVTTLTEEMDRVFRDSTAQVDVAMSSLGTSISDNIGALDFAAVSTAMLEAEQGKLAQSLDGVVERFRLSDEQLNKVESRANAVTETSSRLGFALQDVGEIAKDAGEKGAAAFSTMAKSIEAVVGFTAGLLQQLTGFSFSVDETVQGALDKQAELEATAADLAAQADEAAQAAAEAAEAGTEDAAELAEQAAQAAADAEAAAQALSDFDVGEAAADEVRQAVEQAKAFLLAVVEALPSIIQALANEIPGLLAMVAEQLPIIIQALIENIPLVVIALAQAAPAIIGGLLEAIPDLISSFVAELPAVIFAVAEAIPLIIAEIIANLPAIVLEVLKSIPKIAWALVTGIIGGLVSGIIKVGGEFLKSIGEGFLEIGRKVGDIILNLITLGIAGAGKKDPEDRKGLGKITGAISDGFKAIGGLFGGGGQGAFSGMEYVPATMRMTLHKGEAVIPADRNPFTQPRTTAPAPAGAAQQQPGGGGGGFGSGSVEIAVVAEGRVMNAVAVRAMRNGHGVELAQAMQRSGDVDIGIDRGRYSAWSN